MTPLVTLFIKDKSGTTAIEYALIGVGISVSHQSTRCSCLAPTVSALYDTVAAAIAGAL